MSRRYDDAPGPRGLRQLPPLARGGGRRLRPHRDVRLTPARAGRRSSGRARTDRRAADPRSRGEEVSSRGPGGDVSG
ncbi:hypothetical protein KCH_76960 [Kitasatospora cheerisanensis KCTC 2395]|uniref:Uncharacterized protein n=1 Tax=Kitasatospora cheerisanensis KCTC 2395 TaxID=1348663 RepID=A0A066YKU2_9ACTN|nr:hypothetical protein KCH_76960 [Kitasatospora cheerisanensis KCTC 2395]